MKKMVKESGRLSSSALDTLQQMGHLMAKNPHKIHGLLNSNGFSVSSGTTQDEQIEILLYLIGLNDPLFNRKLAYLMAEEKHNYDSFNLKDLGGAVKDSNITVGADPVSAIAGAVGSLANIVGNVQNRDLMKKQASAQTLSAIMAYKASQVPPPKQKEEGKNNMTLIIGIGLGVLVIVILIVWSSGQGSTGLQL
jgi:hypothetical protein